MLALPNFLNYVTLALASTTYVDLPPVATDYMLWYELFEELKASK